MCLAVPARIEQLFEVQGTLMARVDFGGVTKEICLAYVPDAIVGDYVVVHVGFAISKIDEESATKTLQMIDELGLVDEEVGPHDEGLDASKQPSC